MAELPAHTTRSMESNINIQPTASEILRLHRLEYFAKFMTRNYYMVNWSTLPENLQFEYDLWIIGSNAPKGGKFFPMFLLTAWICAVLGYELTILKNQTAALFRCLGFDKNADQIFPWYISPNQSCWTFAYALSNNSPNETEGKYLWH